jgi:uncharacterized protein with GYD domain
MALYVHLVKATPQGASKIREAGSTYETVRKFGESLGCGLSTGWHASVVDDGGSCPALAR